MNQRVLALLGALSIYSANAFAEDALPFPPLTSRQATAEDLLNVWRNQIAQYSHYTPGKAEIRDFQIKSNPAFHDLSDSAYVRFRPLGDDGKAESWNKLHCQDMFGHEAVGVQAGFAYDEVKQQWVFQNALSSLECSDAGEMTKAQIDDLLTVVIPPAPPKISVSDVSTPAKGSALRKAILLPLHEKLEAEMHKPLEFVIETMNVGGGFAWVTISVNEKGGKPIECVEDDSQSEYWMKLVDGKWKIMAENYCGSDTIVESGEAIGAPPQLVGGDKWPV